MKNAHITHIAFNGKPELKTSLLELLRDIKANDELLSMVGIEAQPNPITKNDWSRLNFPEVLVDYSNYIYENLSKEEANKFRLKFFNEIPVGADLSKIAEEFSMWLETDNNNFSAPEVISDKLLELVAATKPKTQTSIDYKPFVIEPNSSFLS